MGGDNNNNAGIESEEWGKANCILEDEKVDKQSIFRMESLDRVESPEQLDAYIKVSHPKVWLIMAALLVAVISVIVWSVVGSLPQTMTVKGVTVGGNVINCYECVENANTNLIGCKANITLPDGRSISGKVEAVSQNPYSQEEIRAEISEDWLADNVLDGNYSYEVRVIAEEDIPSNMLATVIITTAEMKPIQFILN